MRMSVAPLLMLWWGCPSPKDTAPPAETSPPQTTTPDPSDTDDETGGGPPVETGDSGSDSGDTGVKECVDELSVDVTWHPDHPTVPIFGFEAPADAMRATLTVDDTERIHEFDIDVAGGGTLSFARPFVPGLVASYALELETQDSLCVATGTVAPTAYGAADVPTYQSTNTADPSGHRDYFILPMSMAKSGAKALVMDGYGRVLWSYRVERAFPAGQVSMRTVKLASDGRGVWLYSQSDGYREFDAKEIAEVVLVGWDETVLATYTVPSGHHDWDLDQDQTSIELLGREPLPQFDAACGLEVWGDTLFTVDLATGSETQLWGTVADGYPLTTPCDQLQAGQEYSYVNGYERFGDTRAMSASGVQQAFVVGAADGAWWHLTRDPMFSSLDVMTVGLDLYSDLVAAPHSLVCTEGVDWGHGKRFDPATIVCVGFNRRHFGGGMPCDTTDLFLIDRGLKQARYLTAFPKVNSPSTDPIDGCGTTSSHGNTAIIGEPNPTGDRTTRLANLSANAGYISTLVVTIDEEGLGVAMDLDYVMTPQVEVDGWFVSGYRQLGSGHTIR